MNFDKEKHLIIRITEYALDHKEFQMTELGKELNLSESDLDFIWFSLTSRIFRSDNPNHLIALVRVTEENKKKPFNATEITGRKDDYYTLLPTAFYNYVDYIEIKEARQNATDAKHQSIIALMVAIGSLVLGTFIGLLGIIAQLLFFHN